MFRLATVCLFFSPLYCTPLAAQVFDEKFEHWPVDLKINGRIIVASSLDDPGILKEVIGDADDSVVIMAHRDVSERRVIDFEETLSPETEAPGIKIDIEDLKNANIDKLLKDKPENTGRNISVGVLDDGPGNQPANAYDDFNVVIIQYPATLSDAARMTLKNSHDALHRVVNRGKQLILVGGAAELAAEFFFEINDKDSEYSGLNLMPDCVIETDFKDTTKQQERLLTTLGKHPRCVGIGLAPQTALVLSGRKMRVVGKGTAKFFVKPNDQQPLRTKTIKAGRSRNPENILIDLTQWRRDAIDRTIEQFPPAKPPTPFVENGTLIIVGGGGTPSGLMEQMVKMAGGKENARMVYVPCSESDDVGKTQRTVEGWKRAGIKHATFIHTKDRNKANTDEEFLAPLKDATGIWFGGGRQWNFADSYYGTKAHKLMKDVLRRGGVIGGSSAGASIQARYLARSTPINNFKIMAFGYERGGLGFIGGVAIDQHFSQRGRQKDMTQLVNKYPQLLGIGIDEATAIIVKKSNAKVVGKGKVHFYDRNLPVSPDKPDFIALEKGQEYDLAERKVVVQEAEDE